jgi:hypothetical protein
MERKFFSQISQAEGRIVQFLARIEVAGVQVAPPVKGQEVSQMQNPGTGSPTGWIKEGSLAKDAKEDLLYQIVCFGLVPQDSVGGVADRASIAAEQGAKRFLVSLANLFHQEFVGNLRNLDNGSDYPLI